MQRLCAEYSIQIDNLCQFLPQDKVCEFAALDSVSLLKETQRAAAPPQVLKWHELLMKVGKDQKMAKAQYDADRYTLTNLEGRQRALEPDVTRLRQRQEIIKEIDLYKKAKPFAKYRISREENYAAKLKHRNLQAELDKLQKEQDPSLKRLKERQAYQAKVSKALADVTHEMDSKVKKIHAFKRAKVVGLDEGIKETRAELGATVKKERDRRVGLLCIVLKCR